MSQVSKHEMSKEQLIEHDYANVEVEGGLMVYEGTIERHEGCQQFTLAKGGKGIVEGISLARLRGLRDSITEALVPIYKAPYWTPKVTWPLISKAELRAFRHASGGTGIEYPYYNALKNEIVSTDGYMMLIHTFPVPVWDRSCYLDIHNQSVSVDTELALLKKADVVYKYIQYEKLLPKAGDVCHFEVSKNLIRTVGGWVKKAPKGNVPTIKFYSHGQMVCCPGEDGANEGFLDEYGWRGQLPPVQRGVWLSAENYSYALLFLGEGKVSWLMNGPTHPVVLKNEDESKTVMIMPIRP